MTRMLLSHQLTTVTLTAAEAAATDSDAAEAAATDSDAKTIVRIGDSTGGCVNEMDMDNEERTYACALAVVVPGVPGYY
jgi:hypothetical protein